MPVPSLADVRSIIERSLAEMNDDLEYPLDLAALDETVLYGNSGRLQSLELVSLLVAVEQAIEDEYGSSISLADERAMSKGQSPFRSVAALAEYAQELLRELD